ncbi:MAG: GNAT family N-acetyltransferase [Desulfobacterales bacterium]|nr:GNAT family N-acetyltransferase [Desulfobacterales bacterium]
MITPFTQKHITPLYISWLNNSKIMRYSEQRHVLHTFESCKQYWHSFYDTPNMLWAIEETMNGLGHIGNISTYIDVNNKIADIGILIGARDAQGLGYGYEAFKSVSEYLFKYKKIRKLTAGTVSINLPMLKLMKKMKMRDDGIRIRHYLVDGELVDVVHMALFSEDIGK